MFSAKLTHCFPVIWATLLFTSCSGVMWCYWCNNCPSASLSDGDFVLCPSQGDQYCVKVSVNGIYYRYCSRQCIEGNVTTTTDALLAVYCCHTPRCNSSNATHGCNSYIIILLGVLLLFITDSFRIVRNEKILSLVNTLTQGIIQLFTMFGKCWPSKNRLVKDSASSGQGRPDTDPLDDLNKTASCSAPRVHQLWSYFYCIVLCLIQALLVYRAALTIEENMSNPHLSVELYGYTVGVALSITVSLLAVVASLFRLGNFANDGDKLGKVIVRIQKNRPGTDGANIASNDNGDNSRNPNGNLPLWRRCWQRAAPFAPTCHLIAAFLLLLPRNLLLAKVLAQGSRPELATATEIDIFMRRKTTRLDLYLLLTLSPSSSANSSWAQQVPAFSLGADRPSAQILPSAEWANYILAAVIFASRYPAVFWYTNKSVATFFVFQQLLAVINYATSHAGFVLLFNLASMAKLVPFDFLLHPLAVLFLYVFSLIIVLASSMIIFEYGYEQYLKQIRTYQRLVRRSSAVSRQQLVVSANGHLNETDFADHDNSALTMSSAYSWRSYCSNIAAVVALICLTASKVPLVYDYMTIYRLSEDTLVFVCLISDAVYFFYWIMIWFIFTLKQNWTFLIQHPFIYFRDVAIDSTDNAKTRSLLALSNGNAVYQNNNSNSRLQDNSNTILANAPQPRRHHNSTSMMSRGSSPTRSLMDIAAMTGPVSSGYNQTRLSRPMSAMVNPQIANGLSSPSMPNCRTAYANGFIDGHGAPGASSTLHIYRQSLREKNPSHFYRGGTLGPPGQQLSQNGNGMFVSGSDPKRRSLPAKHYSALNGIPFPTAKLSAIPVIENTERQSLNGWALTSSGTATDIIPEDAPVDSFKPHIPLKLSTSSTCYQIDSNGRLSCAPASSLHESRSDFLLTMSSGVNYMASNGGSGTSASFASIPSIIKKRPPPPPRQSTNNFESNNPQGPSSSSPQNDGSSGTATLTSSSASQV